MRHETESGKNETVLLKLKGVKGYRSLAGEDIDKQAKNILLKVLQGISSKQTSIKMYSNQDSLVLPLYTVFFDDDWFKQQTTERKSSKKTEPEKQSPLPFSHFSSTPPPSRPLFCFPPAFQVRR